MRDSEDHGKIGASSSKKAKMASETPGWIQVADYLINTAHEQVTDIGLLGTIACPQWKAVAKLKMTEDVVT